MNDLLPAIEGTYSTYEEGTSYKDLIASRDHRGFGGFSMGSVATWHTFEYCLDYFRYFMPASGSLNTDASYMDSIVKDSGYEWNDFFILAITGTNDFAASAFEQQIESMKKYTDSFHYSDNEVEGNLTYRIKEGYAHNSKASMEYAYNGLCWFWKTDIISKTGAGEEYNEEKMKEDVYTKNTKIKDVLQDPVFGEYGRLIFPTDIGYYSGDTLGELQFTWYNNMDPDKTVEIANYMKEHAATGDKIFYNIYTDEEKAADPAKKDTGLFFFKGVSGAKFAICNAGGGFAYVGAMHDSFPHALELSKKDIMRLP